MKTEKNKESRVFVLQKQNRYDISAVQYYSKNIVHIVEDERISPFDTFGFIDLVLHRLHVNNFNPEVDFVCLTGSSVLLSLFLAALVRKYNTCDTFKLLIFDAKHNRYKLRRVKFEG